MEMEEENSLVKAEACSVRGELKLPRGAPPLHLFSSQEDIVDFGI